MRSSPVSINFDTHSKEIFFGKNAHYYMKRINPFKGLGVALVTPFTNEGQVDYISLEHLIEKQIAKGVDFLCVLGTTAETPCLTAEEKQDIIDFTVKVVNGRIPLLLGAGGNCTATVCEYLNTADLTGIDGVLIVTPFYNRPSQEGLYQHFCKVASSTKLPVVLYNVPSRTGTNILAETTIRIANDCPNVVAIKEASGKMAQIEDIVAAAPEGFEVLSGDDAITFELISIGAVGVISVIGNAYPADFGKMVHAELQGDFTSALHIHRHLSPLFKLLSAPGNPAGIKALLSIKGDISNVLRLPLVPAPESVSTSFVDWMNEHATDQ